MEQYDYIIVGAGSAGGALAARLSETPSNKILLLARLGKPILGQVPNPDRSIGDDQDLLGVMKSPSHGVAYNCERKGSIPQRVVT